METIWKYTMDLVSENFSIPKDATFLAVQSQYNKPTLWFLVDPSAEKETRTFTLFPTGMEYSYREGYKYLGTIQRDGGSLVWHLFEGGL